MNANRIKATAIPAFLIFLIVLTGFSNQTSAMMLKLNLEELVSGTDAIVIGQVTHRSSRWNRDKTRIFTTVVVTVEERLKGVIVSARLAVAVPGGTIGNITETVTDVPDFSVGEKVVVFVNRLSDARVLEDGLENPGDYGPWFQVYGGFQGKFSILDQKVGHVSLPEFRQRIAQALAGNVSFENESEAISDPGVAATMQMISGISPASASSGTNTVITVSGSGFGESIGKPYFYYKNSEYYGCASCVSWWSESQIGVTVPIFTSSSGYPASAGSGPFYLATSSGIQSVAFPFMVTFSYGGIKWSGTSPVVEFRINPNGDAAIWQAVQDAASTWNAVSNTGFSFKYAGTTTATTTATNQINEIIWAPLQAGVIGQARMRSIKGMLTECDIIFNTLYKWSATASTPKNAMDVHTIALHELGHWLNLRDLYGDMAGYPTDVDKIMYGYGGYGTQKRILTVYDGLGMRYIYPSETPCAASLSMTDESVVMFIPFLNNNPGLWAEIQYDPGKTATVLFKLMNWGETTQPGNSATCQPSTLSMLDNDYILNIPKLQVNGISYQVDLVYVPSTDGQIWFMLKDIREN